MRPKPNRVNATHAAFLQRIYVLFCISLATRRVEHLACSSNPDGRWVTQPARDLVMQLGDEQPFRFLIHDRDTKFSHAFDEVFRTEGIKIIRTPVQAPNANAFAERRVRTVRADCLDRIFILGRRHLDHVLRVYHRHYRFLAARTDFWHPTPFGLPRSLLHRGDFLRVIGSAGVVHAEALSAVAKDPPRVPSRSARAGGCAARALPGA